MRKAVKPLDKYNVGIYLRLSRDDGKKKQESLSIENQRRILENFVKDKREKGEDWNVTAEYVDDGVSGLVFTSKREQFHRMLADVKAGRINCVIVKSIDRLGRGPETELYLDAHFIVPQVRFIALGEDVDTINGVDVLLSLLHAMNGLYPQLVSNKVREVKDDGNARGWFMNSQAPYGYLKSPEDKHKFIIDDKAEHIVKGIFRDYADGISAREIACRLTRDEVDCPSYYYFKRTGKNKPRDGSVNAWTAETIQKMFRRQVYIGHMVSGTREVASIRTKERRIIDEEDWVIVQNTHDPIIEQELWDAVQAILPCEGVSKAPRVRTLRETGDVSLFAGVLRCGKCGSKLAYIPDKRSYRCSRYNNKGKDVCVGPFISETAVCDFVMSDIRQYATLSDAERKSLSSRLTSYFRKEQEVDANAIRSKIKAAEAHLAGVPSELRSLNRDKADGVLPAEAVALMMEDVLKEKAEIESRLPVLRRELDRIQETTGKIDEWLRRVKGCTYIEALDRSAVIGLIDKITVGERIKDPDTKKVTQTLEISYRFIGSLLNAKEDAAG